MAVCGKCIDCAYCRLLDELFCEWECGCAESAFFRREVEMDDGCPLFSMRENAGRSMSAGREELLKAVRVLGKENEERFRSSKNSCEYHDGYLDALSEVIRIVYRQ